jgi:hypothetical protein
MTPYFFLAVWVLAAWMLAAIITSLAAGLFIHAGNPSDDADDWADEQGRAWQARRAEWARQQVAKCESERKQMEAARRWKREVSNQGDE